MNRLVGEVATGAWLTAGYAIFLVLVAFGLDRLARHVSRRAERWRTGGFRYHADHDAWICPEDEWLWPVHYDTERRLVRYRGKATVCNQCLVKHTCTTSDAGREIVRQLDPWPHSEAGRFHRGVALTVTLLAVLLPVASVVQYHGLADIAVLLAAAAVAGVAAVRMATHLRATPANFPTTPPSMVTSRANQQATDRYTTRWGVFPRNQTPPGREQ